MKKKPLPASPKLVPDPGPHSSVFNWRNVPERDLWLYARTFHMAAKKLAGSFELDSPPMSQFDPCPAVFMYRHAIELHLKALVLGEGGNFLATKPDVLSVCKTHSVSWLGQFVCQIIIAVKWEKEFRCEGVESLADFKAIMEELNSVDPVYAFRCQGSTEEPGSVPGPFAFSVRGFACRMDALLGLLDSTADALAATWDMENGETAPDGELYGGSDIKPTIQ